jgi:hypothetical protein
LFVEFFFISESQNRTEQAFDLWSGNFVPSTEIGLHTSAPHRLAPHLHCTMRSHAAGAAAVAAFAIAMVLMSALMPGNASPVLRDGAISRLLNLPSEFTAYSGLHS